MCISQTCLIENVFFKYCNTDFYIYMFITFLYSLYIFYAYLHFYVSLGESTTVVNRITNAFDSFASAIDTYRQKAFSFSFQRFLCTLSKKIVGFFHIQLTANLFQSLFMSSWRGMAIRLIRLF